MVMESSGSDSPAALPKRWTLRSAAVLGITVSAIGLMASPLILLCGPGKTWAARRAQCSNNLRQLAIGLHDYDGSYDSFPPPITYDAAGRSMHSWRVRVGRFLENPQTGQLNSYREQEPWNSPNNLRSADRTPDLFCCPADDDRRFTDYAMVYGGPSPFPVDTGVRLSDLHSSASTMILAESHMLDILWTEPRDLDAGTTGPTVAAAGDFISSAHTSGANVLMADGSVRWIPFDTPPSTVGALIAGESVTSMATRDGGEALPRMP